jgi:serine/threonine-protein kinase RsbT
VNDRVHLAIRDESDVVIARKLAREVARKAGLSETAIDRLATAISEIARNTFVHAGAGEMFLDMVEEAGRRGVVVTARDAGPGISEPARAMQDGYSTAKTLGLGLASARRLVDDFQLVSVPGTGTTVVLKKWTQ